MIRKQVVKRMSEVREASNDNKELTLLSAVDRIVTLAKDSQLSDEFFEEVEPYITYISIRQDITKMQALMLALVIENAVNSGSLSLSDIAVYLDCRNVQVMMYKNEIEELVKKGILRKEKCHISGKYEYAITPTLIDTFAKNEPFQRQSYKNATAIQFFQHFYDITHLRHEDELSTELMVEEIQRLMDENPQLPYVKALRRFRMSAVSQIVITHMSRHLVLYEKISDFSS